MHLKTRKKFVHLYVRNDWPIVYSGLMGVFAESKFLLTLSVPTFFRHFRHLQKIDRNSADFGNKNTNYVSKEGYCPCLFATWFDFWNYFWKSGEIYFWKFHFLRGGVEIQVGFGLRPKAEAKGRKKFGLKPKLQILRNTDYYKLSVEKRVFLIFLQKTFKFLIQDFANLFFKPSALTFSQKAKKLRPPKP